ncbi:type II toxin-antitoxin system RelE/ParE family toxin [Nocardiopsis rhodophaea]|uniref:type II toxin-antitoxin system RelE family toxin n=1 Tax=Nocardiopsis rhodophaea TaxID=280238 RepID=UPI0031D5B94F
MSDDNPIVYHVAYDSLARKELSRLDKSSARRVHAAVLALAKDPRPRGCRQLKGYPGMWRIRVGGYRVVYRIDDGRLTVVALRVAHRREVFRK